MGKTEFDAAAYKGLGEFPAGDALRVVAFTYQDKEPKVRVDRHGVKRSGEPWFGPVTSMTLAEIGLVIEALGKARALLTVPVKAGKKG